MPQTKQQIQHLLNEAGISPRYRWGQNFLIDLNLMRLLVDAADLDGNETILEVGHGTGSLTELLAESGCAVIAVDIDRGLSRIAQRQLQRFDNITFHCCDILSNKSTIAPAVLESIKQNQSQLTGPFYLIANLPYNIASPLIINLLLGDNVPDGIFVTVQAEAAQRMTAKSGTKSYGQLSILTQATGQLEMIRTVNAQSFWPKPKVNSAMLCWRKDQDKFCAIKNIGKLKQVIGLLLGHRRKTIKSCLTNDVDKDKHLTLIQKLGIDPDARGETLLPQQFVQLSNCLE